MHPPFNFYLYFLLCYSVVPFHLCPPFLHFILFLLLSLIYFSYPEEDYQKVTFPPLLHNSRNQQVHFNNILHAQFQKDAEVEFSRSHGGCALQFGRY
jgi:hypothetical protein